METVAATHGPCVSGKRASTFLWSPGWVFVQFSPRPNSLLPDNVHRLLLLAARQDHVVGVAPRLGGNPQCSFAEDPRHHRLCTHLQGQGSWWVQTPRYVPPKPPQHTHNIPPLPPTMMTFATPVATLYTYIRKSRMNRPFSVHPRDASASPHLFVYSMCVFYGTLHATRLSSLLRLRRRGHVLHRHVLPWGRGMGMVEGGGGGGGDGGA